LTASPALGGLALFDWLDETFGLSSPAWQILCAAAAVCALAAAISTQMMKSHHIDERVSLAETCAQDSRFSIWAGSPGG
jgi:hypothetical protein